MLLILVTDVYDALAFLYRHFEMISSESGNRQGNPQALGLALVAGNALDVVGRIAVGGLGDTVERSLDLVESEQERAGQRRNSGHGLKALASDFEGPSRRPLTAR